MTFVRPSVRGASWRCHVAQSPCSTRTLAPSYQTSGPAAPATARHDQARSVSQHFTPDNGCRDSLHTSEPAENNALVDFLFHGKKGYCEQYASAMAVLLRTLDIPSRVSVGFTTGERDGTHRT